MMGWLSGQEWFWGIFYWAKYKMIFTGSFVHYVLDGNNVRASWTGACQDVQTNYQEEMVQLRKETEELRKRLKDQE